MEPVATALDDLGRRIGLAGFRFDREGDATLQFDGVLRISFHRLDPETLEIWAPVEGFGPAHDAGVMRRALEGNHLGEATGGGRIALQPGGSSFVLCERVAVAGMTAEALERRILAFVQNLAVWQSDAAGGPADEAPGEVHGDSVLIRA